MKFAIKLLLGGICATGMGLWWFFDGVTNGSWNQLLGGLVWKGPLLCLVGIGASVMGFRMLREINDSAGDVAATSEVRTGYAELDVPADGGRDRRF